MKKIDILKPRLGVEDLPFYIPEDLGDSEENVINLSANENPYDLPPEIKEEVFRESPAFNRYPDPEAKELRKIIATQYQLSPENIAVGNGADELILELLLAYGGSARSLVTFEPTFVIYSILAKLTGTKCIRIFRDENFDLPADVGKKTRDAKADLVLICSPNNPTGNLVSAQTIEEFLSQSQGLIIIDEAYEEFSQSSVRYLLKDYRNLVILRTFSKAFSLAGLRVGYLLADAEVVHNIQRVKLPYNVNVFSQKTAMVLIEKKAYFERIIKQLISERARVYKALREIDGYQPYPSAANFLLVKTKKPAKEIWEGLRAKRIFVRDVSNSPGLENCLRITIGTPEQNETLIEALRELR